VEFEKREAWDDCFNQATRMVGGTNLVAVLLTFGMMFEELLDKHLTLAQERADAGEWVESGRAEPE